MGGDIWPVVLAVLGLSYVKGRYFSPSSISECPNSTVRLKHTCYHLERIEMSWEAAMTHCSQRGMKLPGPKNRNAFRLLKSYARTAQLNRFWLDLKRINRNGDSTFRHADMKPMGQLAGIWAKGEPRPNSTEKDECVESRKYKWNSLYSVPCSGRSKIICEMKGCPQQCKMEVTPSCMKEGVRLGSTCYYWGKNRVTWTEAELTCRTRGMYLAHIDSKEKHDAVSRYARKLVTAKLHMIKNFWIGIRGRGRTMEYTAMSKSLEVTFWKPGEPNNISGDQSCALYNFNGYYGWNDKECSFTAKYICQECPECEKGLKTDAITSTTTITATTTMANSGIIVTADILSAPVAPNTTTLLKQVTDVTTATHIQTSTTKPAKRSGHQPLNNASDILSASVVPNTTILLKQVTNVTTTTDIQMSTTEPAKRSRNLPLNDAYSKSHSSIMVPDDADVMSLVLVAMGYLHL